MLPSLSRGLRLALVLALSAGYVSWYGHVRPAYAAPKGGGDDDDDSGDDDDSKGGKDEGEDDAADDKDQPPVTAGGLFTMATYPVSELLRPLTITQDVGQVRLGLGTDISAKGAFSTGGLSLEAQYGVSDNFTRDRRRDRRVQLQAVRDLRRLRGLAGLRPRSTSGSPPTCIATRSPTTRCSATRLRRRTRCRSM